ncbi:MAG: energy transducer TonB [Sulfuricurvum sp.]|uniref:energy transducer TonB n=1 Tax=Sulfuricurvum sp. TaxID=2025608 RepID=UPI0025D6AEDA|nr:energy transducer TonB [Sulfuricurvum sp.]MBV5320373.1 energy transducer TonB [Sulfuricurvum sp.]
MIFFNPIVISEKIQNNNSLLKTKSFTASFGVHAALFASIAFFTTTHPIPLPKSDEKITISLAEFTSTSGDIHKMEAMPQPKEHHQSVTQPQKPVPNVTTTPQERPSLTPSVSPEASAPLAMPHAASSLPSSSTLNDSPHLTPSTPEHELPRNPVSENKIGGAALGHIRAMIENAITYPAIARKLRLEGVVLVTFTLKPDGTVDTAQVKSTSGSNVLDNRAIQTILSLSGYYPSLGKTFELSIPIAFNLHKS